MTITSPDGYNLSLTDACKESYKSFLNDGTVVLRDENTSKLSVVTNYKNIYRLEINVKTTDNTLVETQNIDFQALDITSVQNESLQEELNTADVNSRTTSSVQTSHDSQSMTVKYTSPGSYTWSIPSEVDLNNQQRMTVSATKVNEEANASLKISVSSENDFKMKSSTGRMSAYKITQDGKQIQNNSIVLETTSTGTSSTDLNFFAYPGNFMTAGTYNDTLTFKAQNGYATGTVLEIEGMKFIVMGQTDDDTYMLIDGESIGNMQYQPNIDSDGNYKINLYEAPDEKRPDKQYANTYEDSYIDKYLENVWYKKLPVKLQKAILSTNISQLAYSCHENSSEWKYMKPNGANQYDWYFNEGTSENPKWIIYINANYPENASGKYPYKYWKSYSTGYYGVTYNEISRHVFLPSVAEVANLVDLNNANKTYEFLKGTNNSAIHMWLRDVNKDSYGDAIDIGKNSRSLSFDSVSHTEMSVRPAFVIDLSKVDATVVDTVHYK